MWLERAHETDVQVNSDYYYYCEQRMHELFNRTEKDAVRWCFGIENKLPVPAVESILEFCIERRDWIDDMGWRHIEFYKDGERHGMWEWWFDGKNYWEEKWVNGTYHERYFHEELD